MKLRLTEASFMFLLSKRNHPFRKSGFIRSLSFFIFLCGLMSSPPARGQEDDASQKEISQILYLTANIGNVEEQEVLDAITQMSSNEERADLLLLGNSTAVTGYEVSGKDSLAAQKVLRQKLLDPLQNLSLIHI